MYDVRVLAYGFNSDTYNVCTCIQISNIWLGSVHVCSSDKILGNTLRVNISVIIVTNCWLCNVTMLLQHHSDEL